MVFLHAFLILAVVSVVNGKCYDNNWLEYKFHDHQVLSYPSCFMRGLVYGTETSSDREIVYLKGDTSCTLPSPWNDVEKVVKYTDWTGQFVKNNWWLECPSGYFLAGFGILDFWKNLTTTFSNMVSGRCVRPAGHPMDYGQCYTVEASSCFADKRTCSCGDGYYVTGLHKSQGIQVTALNKLKCCSMVQGPEEIQSFDVLKTQIMERASVNLACMAELLGFIHPEGARGVNCGEDFIRLGDSWKASTKMFDKSRNCSELKCDERLRIDYENWDLKVATISYGQSEAESLRPEVVDNWKIQNNGTDYIQVKGQKEVPTTVKLNVAKNLHSCIKHTIDFRFDIPIADGTSLEYKTQVPLSEYSAMQNSTLKSKPLNITFRTENIAHYAEVVYNITLTKKKTRIPFTAVIAVHFSTRLEGFLRWQRKQLWLEKNYHSSYINTTELVRCGVHFGYKGVPFYEHLESDMESNHSEWLWDKMINDSCFERSLIDKMFNRKYYEFKIDGTLEIVSGYMLHRIRADPPIYNIDQNMLPIDIIE